MQEQQLDYRQASWPCVLDSATGLIWEVKTGDHSLRDGRRTYSWYDPQVAAGLSQGHSRSPLCGEPPCNTYDYAAAVNAMSLCGSNKWRLPRREELRSLMRYDANPQQELLDKRFFPNGSHGFYWSGIPDYHDTDSAWGIGTTFGFDYSYFTANPGYVRLVQVPHTDPPSPSATSQRRFENRAHGTIVDTLTQTVWSRCQLGQRWTGSACEGQAQQFTWQQALALLETWNQNGLIWRLPDLKTLSSLWQADKYNPAIVPDAFPETHGAPYWTSTSFAQDLSRHWVVNFFFGENDVLDDSAVAFARPVLVTPAPPP